MIIVSARDCRCDFSRTGSAASNEQTGGIEQINIVVAEMDKVTQQNDAGAEELASSIAMFKTSKDIAGKITGAGYTGRGPHKTLLPPARDMMIPLNNDDLKELKDLHRQR